MCASGIQRDRLLRAVLLGGDSLLLELAGDLRYAHDAVPDLVGVEDVGRQRIAASMPYAAICVDGDAGHGVGPGKVSGSVSTDRNPRVYLSSTPGLIA